MDKQIPSREEIEAKLIELCNDQTKRQLIAEWAVTFIEDDSLQLSDLVAWKFLIKLGAADLPLTDGDYLYGVTDFEEWLLDLVKLRN